MDLGALRNIGYGMYIIGARKGDRYNAQIANTLFQITSDPPTLAVSINKNNLTHEFIKESRSFSASVLCEETTMTFIGKFGFKSGRDTNKFENIDYKIGTTGSPIVTENATSYFEVAVEKEVDMVTHTIFIGRVVMAEVLNQKTSMSYAFYHQVKRGLTPKAAPSFIVENKPS